MRSLARAAVLLVVLAAGAPGASAFEGNVNVFVGQKWLEKGDWEPIETQGELGVLLAFGETRSPIHFALDILHSEDDAMTEVEGLGAAEFQGKTTEYGVGIRKVFRRFAITHPHIGAGATFAVGEFDVVFPGLGRSQVDDTAFGWWVDGGITWRLASHFNLGVEVRYSRYALEFGNIFLANRVEGGGFHAGALVGYGW